MMKNSDLKALSVKQNLETAIIIVVILVITGILTDHKVFYFLSVFSALIAILFPVFFHPAAILWFGLAKKLGTITSYLLLGIIFYLIVTPVALIRRLAGKDKLNLKKFKTGRKSVFIKRNHKYESSDMIHTY
jgi:hypothetical protein